MKIVDDKSERGRLMIDIDVTDEGGIKIEYFDVGKGPAEAFGSSTYERTLTVPREEIAKLAMHLIADRFEGDMRTQSKIEAFCKERGIRTSIWKW